MGRINCRIPTALECQLFAELLEPAISYAATMKPLAPGEPPPAELTRRLDIAGQQMQRFGMVLTTLGLMMRYEPDILTATLQPEQLRAADEDMQGLFGRLNKKRASPGPAIEAERESCEQGEQAAPNKQYKLKVWRKRETGE